LAPVVDRPAGRGTIAIEAIGRRTDYRGVRSAEQSSQSGTLQAHLFVPL
jgi:hypothetical protein